jgi:hypothetical protein
MDELTEVKLDPTVGELIQRYQKDYAASYGRRIRWNCADGAACCLPRTLSMSVWGGDDRAGWSAVQQRIRATAHGFVCNI